MSNNINNNSNARANRGFASSSSSNGGGHGAAAAAKSNSAPRRYQASPSQTGFDSRPSLRSAASASGSGSISNDSADPREKFFPNSRNYYLDDTDDDALHRMDRDWDHSSKRISWRGFLNLITLLLLALGLLALFAGYPIYSHFYELSKKVDTGAFNLGGTNGTGQVPDLPIRGLVDGDTLDSDKKITLDGVNYHIVFSDEFETPGRTFWPGDDPYWEAVDIYYAATFDYEWYSPEAVNTSNGALVITMEEKETHNLNFRSGMLQSWNKFCFQGGYIEFAIKQPGAPTHQGYWPAAWLMGNLGRAGYLGSTQGTWPYSYQSCDTGILDRQQFVNGSGPEAAINSNAIYANKDGTLSSLPGMRMSACTCPGEDHAGPNVNVGRSAPELDILEAQFQNHDGSEHIWASQSMQTAPFDVNYQWGDGATQAQVYDPTITEFNSYVGSPLQQCVSSITQTPDRGFQLTNGEFVKFGLDYSPDWDNNGNGYVTWYVDGKKTWTVHGSALGPNPAVDIGRRPIPTEPMSIIMNLGIAQGFQPIKWTGANSVVFPAVMEFDYVRVYQRDGQKDRITCDPEDHPTADYIARHPDLYYNPNITTYSSVYGWPKNRIKDGC